ncbi:MAG: nucleotidyltransferase domain-containing protein [Clostridia bacterium]|nr:nucleotidyltransferase domain-containing protein [Clostridia bacterium]
MFEKENALLVADRIINYLTEKYQPDAIITYGSFADGSANENSDFDALIIANREKMHDSSVIDGIILDVFIYPADMFQSEYDPEEFIQICDGKIVLDKNGIADRLQKRVLDYIAHTPQKTADEIQQEIRWCEKMTLRTMRDDAEGYYRWHWLLCDSLEIYCDVKGLRYYGPKKALRLMEKTDEAAFQIYSKALKTFERESLSEWICYLKHISSVS